MKTLKIIDILSYISTKSFDKLPEEIKYKGRIFKLNRDRDYISTTSGLPLAKYLDNVLELELNSEVEILKENGELEDIEELKIDDDFGGDFLINDDGNKCHISSHDKTIINRINKIIRNQKKMIERLKYEDSE